MHWCYIEDKELAKKYWDNNELKAPGRQVYCYELNKTFKNITLGAKEVGLKNSSRISTACNNWNKTSAKMHWCYIEDKETAIIFWRNETKLNLNGEKI